MKISSVAVPKVSDAAHIETTEAKSPNIEMHGLHSPKNKNNIPIRRIEIVIPIENVFSPLVTMGDGDVISDTGSARSVSQKHNGKTKKSPSHK